jgi:hypothetical protein
MAADIAEDVTIGLVSDSARTNRVNVIKEMDWSDEVTDTVAKRKAAVGRLLGLCE